MNYSVGSALSINGASPAQALPSWLSAANNGITREGLTFTAHPQGLADGARSTLVQLTGAGAPLPPGLQNSFPFALGYLETYLRIGPVPPPASLTVSLNPPALTFRFTDPSQQQSATVHLSTSADPMSFSVGQLPSWLTASPSSGQTPAEITFTATSSGSSGAYSGGVFVDVGGALGANLQVTVDVSLPGYAGSLSALPIAAPFPQPQVARGIAPASLFGVVVSIRYKCFES